MTHFKQLTWKQHFAYLSCAIALVFTVAAYQKQSVYREVKLSVQPTEATALFKLRRSVKRLRSAASSRSIALQMLGWESTVRRDRN